MANFLNGNSGDSNLVFSAYDTANGVGYTFDIGVALSAIVGADNVTTGTTLAAANATSLASGVIYDGTLTGFETFVTTASSLSSVEWNLAAAESNGRNRVLVTEGDTAAAVTANNSKVSNIAGNFLSYMDGITGKVGSSVNVVETTVSDNSAYAGGATWGNTAGVTSGVEDNTNILADGASANLFLLSQSSTAAGKAGQAAFSAQIQDGSGAPLTVTIYKEGDFWKLKVQAVVVDSTAPTVSSVDYGTNDGVLAAGEAINFVVNFSEIVDVAGGTPTLTLDNGATATYVSGTGTSALTFTYTAATGDASSADLAVTAFNLSGATIKDAAGNNADTAAAIANPTGTVTLDATAPTVTTFSPNDEALNVSGTANIVVTFSEAIAKGTGNIVITNSAGDTIASYDVATSSNVTVSGSVLTINPTDDLANAGAYTVSFAAGSITDLAGNAYAGTASYNFTTTTFVNGGNGNGDLVFSAWDNAAGVGYTFDLGLSLNKLLGADNSGAGAAIAANTTLDSLYTNGSVEISLSGLSDFMNNPALASVEWNLAAADSAGRARVLITQGDSSSSMAMNNSKVATTANNYNNYLDAVGALDGQGVNPVLSVSADNAAYAGGATWSNSAGVSGGLDNSNLLTQGSSANLILLAQTNSATSQATTAYTTQVIDANGTPMTAKVYQDANGEWKLLLTTSVDTSAPTVTAFSPNDAAIEVLVNSNIEITFSETVKLGTGNIVIKDAAGKVFATYDVATSDNVSVLGNKLVINPTGDLAKATGYTVELAAGTVQDLSGNNFAGDTSYNFNTEHFDSIATGPTNTFNFTNIGTFSSTIGAEISAYDAVSKHLFVTSPANGLQIVDISNPGSPTLVKTVDFTAAPFNFANNVNSVAVHNGVIAVAVAAANNTDTGKVIFIDADGNFLKSVDVGSLPDMLTFSPDGTKLLVANEGESSLDTVNPQVNPAGSVSIIDISTGVVNASVITADFTAFNGQEQALRDMGVRIFNGNSASVDLEPEYIAISPDGTKAFVTLQEANAIGILDIATGTFTDIVPLGLKSWEGLLFDGSDRDNLAGTGNAIDLVTTAPVFGMFQPDAIDAYTAGGQTYYITANEGDDRNDFLNPNETTTVSASDLDNAAFPNETTIKTNPELGRLATPSAAMGMDISGDTDGDGDIDQILTYGGRSFSILDSTGKMVFDSGDHIERYLATTGLMSAGGNYDDSRSDNKASEPEGVTISEIAGRTLAFIGLERANGVMVYDVTDPNAVSFVTFLTHAGDISPEGVTFISDADSPTGSAILVVSNEVSNTVSFYTYDNLAPTVTTFSPADELTSVQVDSNITVTFSEAMMLGTGNIVLKSGGNVIETYNVATSTNISLVDNVLTINPSDDLVGLTQYSVEFDAGSLTDLAGNAYAGTTTYNFTTVVDNVAPSVLTFAPADEATEVAIDSNIVVTFSEAIARGTGNIVIKDGSIVIATFDAATSSNLSISGNTLTINPSADLGYGVSYSVEFAAGSIKDTANNSYVGTTTYNFITENDFDAPVITAFSPTDGATDVALNSNLAVTFNEPFKFGSGNIVLRDANDVVIETFDVANIINNTLTINGPVLTINPTANLLAETGYYLEFDTGSIQDVYGNNLDGNLYEGSTAFNFSTNDTIAPTVSSFSPVDGATAVAVNSDITVTFSETVLLGTGNILLKDGSGNVLATYDVATSTNLSIDGSVLTINPSDDLVGLSDYSIEFAAGTITDVVGNDYAGSTSYNFTTAADNVEPIVLTFVPSDEEAEAAVDSNIVLTFSEAIVRGTGNIVIKNGETVIATYDAATSNNLSISGNTLTINPTANLSYGVDYTVEFAAGSIKDSNNNSFAGTTTYNFTTEDDFDAPLLTTVDGPTAATLAADLTLTFNEAVKFDAGNIILKDADGNVIESFDVETSTKVSISGAVLTINPTANLKPLTTYYVEFDTGAIQDMNSNSLDGNLYEGELAYNFTTLDNTVLGATTGNNKLQGTLNDDILDGLAGKDTMIGLAGDDTYVVDNSKDVVTEGKNAGTDLVVSTISFSLAKLTNIENLTLNGSETTKLTGAGNNGANVITGDDGTNKLSGLGGNDTVFGGLGKDTLLGDAGNDSLSGDEGNDSIDGGIGLDTISGGIGRDILLGGNDADILFGGDDGDKMDGGTGNDILSGDAGNDTLKGGLGSDVFTFGDDSGFDMISDLTYTAAKGKVIAVEDTIRITGHYNGDDEFDATDFTVREGFDGILITFADKGGQILIKGISDATKLYFNDTDDLFTLRNDPTSNVVAGTDD